MKIIWACKSKGCLLVSLTVQSEPVRTYQEEQIPGLQPDPGAPLCLLPPQVPADAAQREDHPL